MEFEVDTSPTGPTVTVSLAAGERIGARPGTLVTRTESVRIDTLSEDDGGGVAGMIRNALGDDDDVLRNVFEATAPGTITLAPDYPGDVAAVDLAETGPLNVRADAVFAWTDDVEEGYAADAPPDLFAGERTVPRQLARGTVFLAAFGDLSRLEVSGGDPVLVDEDHLLAWTPSLDVSETKDSRIKSSRVGDSGFLVRFEGTGTVWLRTRDPTLVPRTDT